MGTQKRINFFSFSISNYFLHTRGLTDQDKGQYIDLVVLYMINEQEFNDKINQCSTTVQLRFNQVLDDIIFYKNRAYHLKEQQSLKGIKSGEKRVQNLTVVQPEINRGSTTVQPIKMINDELKCELELNENEKVKKHKYGEYKKVLLTEEEYKKLKIEFGSNLEHWIKTLDEGIALKGYSYKSHYLAIKKWSKNSKSDSMSIEEKLKIAESWK